jgi:hypothetical protein
MDDEVARFKWLAVAGLLFLMSGFYSLNELRYAVFAKTVDAAVTGMRETMSTGRRRQSRIAVEYQFTESGGATRSERDEVSTDWPIPTTGTVAVQYIPGVEKASRLKGHWSWVAVYTFMGCVAWLGFLFYKLSREANEPIRRRK